MSENDSGRSSCVVLATMFMLFAMIQFWLNFAGSMGVVLQNQFGVSNVLGAFLSGDAACLLDLVVNPMLNSLGVALFAYLFLYAALLSRRKGRATV